MKTKLCRYTPTPDGEEQHTISQYRLSPALTVFPPASQEITFLLAATRWRGWLACKGHNIRKAYHFKWQNHSQHRECSHSEETGETTWSHSQVTPPPLISLHEREDGVHVGQVRGVEQAQVNIHKFENNVMWHNCTWKCLQWLYCYIEIIGIFFSLVYKCSFTIHRKVLVDKDDALLGDLTVLKITNQSYIQNC